MQPRTRALLLFSLGILLVLNPVYLFPEGVPVERTYTYRAEQADAYFDFRDVVYPSAVLDCADSIVRRECVLARQVGYGGTFRVDNSTAVQLEDDEHGLLVGYDYVRFDEGYARPNATVESGTLVLTTEPRSRAQVWREYATPYDELPPVGQRAVRNGTASTTRQVQFGEESEQPISEDYRFVSRNGTFYRIDRVATERQRLFPPWVLTLGRIGGLSGGVLLAFVGASRHARIVDEQGSDSRGRRRTR